MTTKQLPSGGRTGNAMLLTLLTAHLCLAISQPASANDAGAEEAQEVHPVKLQDEKVEALNMAEPVAAETVDVPPVTAANLQNARDKVATALKEKGEHSIEMTEARLELARLELKNLVEQDDLQRMGALISLKKDKVRVLENLLQRKIAAERSRAEAEKSRIAAELLKRELAQEIKELAQEQKELALVKKEEVQALEEEAQARTELQEVIKQLNQKIKELNRKVQ
jgi:hypothetical protein